MSKASEIKRGSIVELNGSPHIVEDLQVQSPSARGGSSFYKVRFRDLTTKQKVDKQYRGNDTLSDIDFERREVQFLYTQGDSYEFMDLEDYSQFSMNAADIKDCIPCLVEDMEGIRALISDGRILGIELPPTVEMSITDCGPSMKGASATARTKPATLSTGLIVQVPEYLAPGEVIRVDTRTSKFIGRA